MIIKEGTILHHLLEQLEAIKSSPWLVAVQSRRKFGAGIELSVRDIHRFDLFYNKLAVIVEIPKSLELDVSEESRTVTTGFWFWKKTRRVKVFVGKAKVTLDFLIRENGIKSRQKSALRSSFKGRWYDKRSGTELIVRRVIETESIADSESELKETLTKDLTKKALDTTIQIGQQVQHDMG